MVSKICWTKGCTNSFLTWSGDSLVFLITWVYVFCTLPGQKLVYVFNVCLAPSCGQLKWHTLKEKFSGRFHISFRHFAYKFHNVRAVLHRLRPVHTLQEQTKLVLASKAARTGWQKCVLTSLVVRILAACPWHISTHKEFCTWVPWPEQTRLFFFKLRKFRFKDLQRKM